MRKLWDKLVALIYKVPFDKWLHFMAGLISEGWSFSCL